MEVLRSSRCITYLEEWFQVGASPTLGYIILSDFLLSLRGTFFFRFKIWRDGSNEIKRKWCKMIQLSCKWLGNAHNVMTFIKWILVLFTQDPIQRKNPTSCMSCDPMRFLIICVNHMKWPLGLDCAQVHSSQIEWERCIRVLKLLYRGLSPPIQFFQTLFSLCYISSEL